MKSNGVWFFICTVLKCLLTFQPVHLLFQKWTFCRGGHLLSIYIRGPHGQSNPLVLMSIVELWTFFHLSYCFSLNQYSSTLLKKDFPQSFPMIFSRFFILFLSLILIRFSRIQPCREFHRWGLFCSEWRRFHTELHK